MIYDLSHTISDGLVTYKGLPAPIICDFLSREDSRTNYEPGTEFQIGKIEMVANTGTYIDVPYHRYADGADLSAIGLEQLVDLPIVLIHHTEGLAIEAHEIPNDLTGKAVLIRTDWSQHWNTETYFENHPYVTEEAAIKLRDGGARLVGIDSYNIDDTRENIRPTHSVLLRERICIIEHMNNLDTLPDDQLLVLTAAPPKIVGMGSFPVRVFAKTSEL
jgi:kynurenine formamidase